ncbi:hypothetical protein [Telluribacter sp.]|jgi:hypothetical protein|uniref:hypothetical protein n=1 Tax=Telluribacter sp. TaxID=1978767 RepID=UPI002E0E18D4|nr:hypothetical protein [Telluribacter sp.]
MEMTKEEFDERFVETLDALLVSMAESPEIDVNKFYNMTCILENLRFFSPVLFATIQNARQ